VKEDGAVLSLWESAACMLYIVAEFDKDNTVSYPVGSNDYWQMVAWVRFKRYGITVN
jgi:glutathione S-transferase